MTSKTDKKNDAATEALPRVQFGFAETAAMCGMPLSTFDQECRRGNGPVFYKVGRRKFTTRELIDQWLGEKIAALSAK